MDRRSPHVRPGQQLAIDFDRGEQLGLLRNLRLPDVVAVPDGPNRRANVSAVYLKAVLKAIDDHGGGKTTWVGEETIAAEIGAKGRRQVVRAIAALQALDLITCDRRHVDRKKTMNYYAIVWTELNRRQVSAGTRPTETMGTSSPTTNSPARVVSGSRTRRDQCAMVADQCAMVADQCATGGTRSAPEAPQEAPPPNPPHAASASGEAWQRAAAEFFALGMRRAHQLANDARQRGTPVDAWREQVRGILAIAQHAANRSLFRAGPMAAACYRLKYGHWPAEGVRESVAAPSTSPTNASDELQAARQRREQEHRGYQIVTLGRRQGVPDELIRAKLIRELPRDVVAALGWLPRLPETIVR